MKGGATLGTLGTLTLVKAVKTFHARRRRCLIDGGWHIRLIGTYRFDRHQRAVAVLNTVEHALTEKFVHERATAMQNFASDRDGNGVNEEMEGRICVRDLRHESLLCAAMARLERPWGPVAYTLSL